MTRLPAAAGVGFKSAHFDAIMRPPGQLPFFEVHAENYMGAGGLPHAQLTALCRDHALSVHGVGLSIGGPGALDPAHLARLRRLCDRYAPVSFSEHLAWSSHGEGYLNDLLPLPYTAETLARVCDHVDQVQETLGRPMLIENPATYILFAESEMGEGDFLCEITRRTGCGLLLDVNNVFVSATNHRTDPMALLLSMPLERTGEIHLGGHAREDLPSGPLLIDTHGAAVADPVWDLFAAAIGLIGPVATLVEWDNDVPDWATLLAEAQAAQAIIDARTQVRHARAC